MAICLTRNIRSCSSFVFVSRRNHHANSCDLKATNSAVPLMKEVNPRECSPSNLSRNFNNNNNKNNNKNNNNSNKSNITRSNCNCNSISSSNSSNSSYRDSIINNNVTSCSNSGKSKYNSSSGRNNKSDDNKNLSHISHNVNNIKTMASVQVSADNVFCAQECKAYKEMHKESNDNLKRANKTQLQHIANILINDLPELFNKNMNYKIYHPNMIFENNIRGTKTVGVLNYMREIFILKIIGNIRFSYVKFTILKITDHPEDGTVRVRWRIVGISQFKNILRMIKHMAHKYPEPEGWYDGFSIFYVRSDGLIHKHIVDKMIPDAGEKMTSLRNPLVAKMAFAVGISMKDFTIASVLRPEVDVDKKYSEVRDFIEINKPSLAMNFEPSAHWL